MKQFWLKIFQLFTVFYYIRPDTGKTEFETLDYIVLICPHAHLSVINYLGTQLRAEFRP